MQRILIKSLAFIRKTMICQFQLHIIYYYYYYHHHYYSVIMITSRMLFNSLLNYVNFSFGWTKSLFAGRPALRKEEYAVIL
jgi:hypothetical protein